MSKTKRLHISIFDVINVIFFLLLAMITLFPFLNLLAKSLSSESALLRGDVVVIPKGFQTGTYTYVIRQSQFKSSIVNTVTVTLLGTALAMAVTCLTAYPLSCKKLPGRKGFLLYFILVMMFSGGMVPSYLLMRLLRLTNTIFVLFIPQALSVYNMILLKNFFGEIPESLEESAMLDGASRIRVLISIVLPISLPALATIGLFYAVAFWNDYMSGILYITRPALKPLQQYLYELVTESIRIDDASMLGTLTADQAMDNLTPEAIRAATVMLSSLPILCLYPFLQKYFVQGIVVGAVKG